MPHLANKWKFIHFIKNRSQGDLVQEKEMWRMPYTEFLVLCNYWNDVHVQELNKKMGG